MSELIEIEQGQEIATLTTGIKAFIERIKKKVDFVNYDVETKQGRESIVSSAFKVTKSKTGIVKEIDRLIELKKEEIAPVLETIELLKESKKITNSELSALAKKTRQVVTDWEIEQEETAQKLLDEMKAKKLSEQLGFDHEYGLIMNRNFDLELADKKRAEQEKRAEPVKKKVVFEPMEVEKIETNPLDNPRFKKAEDRAVILGRIERYLMRHSYINNEQAQKVVFALMTCDYIEIKY